MNDVAQEAIALRAQLETMRERLQETEEVCRAIREGAVDGFVVGQTDEQKRVLLMSGAYTRYRQVVEDMEQGAATITASGEILFANHALAGMLDVPVLDLFRTQLADWVLPAERGLVEALLRPIPGQEDIVLTLVRGRKSLRTRVSVVSTSNNFVTLLFTDQSRIDQLKEAEATLEAIRSGGVDAFVVGSEGAVRLLEGTRRATDASTRKFLSMLALEIRDIVAPIQETAERIRKSKPERDTREAAALIHRQTDRLLALVEDLRRMNLPD
jgi:nitrogen-specific signal transduction histidine kinase